MRECKVMVLAAASLSAAALALPSVATAAPANDNFASPQVLTGTSTSASGTTVGASREPNEPSHFVSGNGSVWYSWTAPVSSNVRLNVCTSQNATAVLVYTGSSLASLSPVETTPDSNCGGFNGSDKESFHATAGTTYRIVVIEYVTQGTFTLSLSAPAAPANDDFAKAQNIGSLPVRIAATTTDTTVEPGEEGYFGSPSDAQSVWYRWTAPKDTRIWFDDCGQDFGTQTTIYRGSALNSLTPVSGTVALTPEGPPSCDDLYAGHSTGEISAFMARAGTTYRIQVLLDDINLDPDFHLGMREARFDGSLSQTRSRKVIHHGQTVTYKLTVRNLGTLPMSPAVELITSKPHKLAQPVVGSRYVSLKPSQGSCRRVKFFAVHPGAICEPGRIPPGGTVKITAKVRPSGSLTHWVELDYLHGGEGNNRDDNPRNDSISGLTTVVKSAHHR